MLQGVLTSILLFIISVWIMTSGSFPLKGSGSGVWIVGLEHMWARSIIQILHFDSQPYVYIYIYIQFIYTPSLTIKPCAIATARPLLSALVQCRCLWSWAFATARATAVAERFRAAVCRLWRKEVKASCNLERSGDKHWDNDTVIHI